MLRNKVLYVTCFFICACSHIKRSGEYVFNRYKIVTPSMSPTLQIGEVYPIFSADTFVVNDIIGYHPPLRYRGENSKVVWLHRLVGCPGDLLEMKNGLLLRNGKEYKPVLILKHSYIVECSMPLNKNRLESYEYDMFGIDNTYLFHATKDEITELKKNKAVKRTIPNYSDSLTYNKDAVNLVKGLNPNNWGPLRIPKRGDMITLTPENQKQYETILSEYELPSQEMSIGDKFTCI